MAARCALWWRYRSTMLGPLLWRALWGRPQDIEWLADRDERAREVA
jgi:hypothetical protein